MKKSLFTKAASRRLTALLLVVFLAVVLCGSVFAAQTASGKDMRLTAVEGTVSVKNLNGKTISVREGMKLYSGYTVTTSAKSYAYVTLDSQKVIKLDANTKAEIRSQGNKLELMVASGKIFFNVKSPLTSSESLNIRTSTMVTGIRGTSGYVSVQNDDSSSVAITDGKVQVWSAETGSDSMPAEVSAGQVGSTAAHGDGTDAITVSDLMPDAIPGFVAIELQKDETLRQRVAEDTDLPVDEIAASAEQRLQQDEAEAEKMQNAIDQSAAKLPNRINRMQAFQEPSYVPSTPADPTPEEPGDGAYHITRSITAAELQQLLNENSTTNGFDVVVDSGVTLTIASDGSVTFTSGQSLTIESGAEMAVEGIFASYDVIENNGTIRSSDYFYNYGVLTNNGTIEINGGNFNNANSAYSSSGVAEIINNGQIVINNAELTNSSGSILTNNAGATIESSSGSTLNNQGTFVNDGTFVKGGAYIGSSPSGNGSVVENP